MNEIESILKKYKFNDLFINIKSNVFLKNGEAYLECLFNCDEQIINYEKINFEFLDCFSNNYCMIFKYDNNKYLQQNEDILSEIMIELSRGRIIDERIKLIYKYNNNDVVPMFYILPIRNDHNDYLSIIIPEEIIQLKNINYTEKLEKIKSLYRR